METPWYGFNLLPMFIKGISKAQKDDIKAMDFMAEEGFNYVRIPMDYRLWTRGFDYLHPDDSAFSVLDEYIREASDRGLHISINLHRAPGYCINRNDIERDNLWTDRIAQEGFEFIWSYLARKYKHISAGLLSFDLLNEPPHVGQYGCTRDVHHKVITGAIDAVRSTDPARVICINGIGCGHLAIPELSDTGTVHSGRGYTPIGVSHYMAEWMEDRFFTKEPSWPFTDSDGLFWNRDSLKDFYEPWKQVHDKGTKVFIGELGCYNKTPNKTAVGWLKDLLSVFTEYGWGFAFWNFKGPFGIVDHGREGARVESYNGFPVDRELLDVIKENMKVK